MCLAIMKNGGVFIINDFVIDLLNLEAELLESVSYKNINGEVHIIVKLKKTVEECPHCGISTRKTNGSQTVVINHGVFNNRRCNVHLRKYRYVCTLCDKTFMLKSQLAPKRRSISHESIRQIMELTKDPRITFKFISDQLNISVTSAIRIFIDNAPDFKRPLPSVLCIDEVYLGKSSRRKYAVVLMDFISGEVFDLVYGRSTSDCIRSFNHYRRDERLSVEYFSTDMYTGFIRLSKSMFPNAKICVDSFHVISLIITSFQKMLVSIMNQYDRTSVEYYLLKNHRYLLLKNSSNINWTEGKYNRKLKYYISNYALHDLIKKIDPRISECYEIKEKYINFNKLKSFDGLDKRFDYIITEFINSSYHGFNSVGRTLIKNKEYIINSFSRINGRRISNGPIESRNNVIKTLLRVSSGYRNFEHLRLRALYVLNTK